MGNVATYMYDVFLMEQKQGGTVPSCDKRQCRALLNNLVLVMSMLMTGLGHVLVVASEIF